MSFPLGSIPVTGLLGLTGASDDYATHFSNFGLGGHMQVDTISDRNNIPLKRRRFGMTCFVCNDFIGANNGIYVLANSVMGGVNFDPFDNDNWIRLVDSKKDLKVFYVNGYNPENGNGSITNPFKTIDLVVDFIRTNSITNVTIFVYGFGSYTTSQNIYLPNCTWYFERGSRLFFNGSGYLIDDSAFVSQPCKVLGFCEFFINSGALIKAINNKIIFEFFETRINSNFAGPIILLEKGVEHNISGTNQTWSFFAKTFGSTQPMFVAQNKATYFIKNIWFGAFWDIDEMLIIQGNSFNSRFQNCVFAVTNRVVQTVMKVVGINRGFRLENCKFIVTELSTTDYTLLFEDFVVVDPPNDIVIDTCYFDVSNGTSSIYVTSSVPMSSNPLYADTLQVNFKRVDSKTDIETDPGKSILNLYSGPHGFFLE